MLEGCRVGKQSAGSSYIRFRRRARNLNNVGVPEVIVEYKALGGCFEKLL